jgi:hypothetical protein
VRQLLGIVLALGALLGASALAIERFDDRELFVPPPDAVAEQFVRAVVYKRYDQAREYLAEGASQSLPAVLEDATEVEAETIARDDERALVNVRMSDGERSEAVAFTLVFESEWKIDR